MRDGMIATTGRGLRLQRARDLGSGLRAEHCEHQADDEGLLYHASFPRMSQAIIDNRIDRVDAQD
jgi:hypothetical protein